ncbi:MULTISPECIES: hypothetical protein [Nitrosomonas]|uniref:Uncharacterized protein n=1 Tax=Nitrosomonas europaea (strain ATCC 19718 / CIP 103999 / KCTC 2705 / NBRC 14298) TaxID=228410 RepID=Q82UD9_NITEU|nr:MULTISPECIES: hypothetical protein [Nitrosomonas]KXK51124.1 MAG: hypothetical protein UZ02_AOB001000005 [Nitrosomonas europaea]CAD85462.1 hypothetical protein NE1551 [Nitrosomonas europaea ATCC 19718]SDW70006.1 hypothetical protein SAMN05216310_1312 [Nitrosomonas europaea]SET48954.1 hypothetical protein SAMN05216309_1632 [Nitrosomonas europaea]SJZ82043.1 hypothetical protein SAMN02745113_01957 [Nitrosomonas europaea]
MRTKYILELFDTSEQHKPIARFESSTPFTAASVGERFDDIGWERLDGAGKIASPLSPKRYTVHSAKHLVIVEAGALVIKYCLNLEPFSGPSSPVWGDE